MSVCVKSLRSNADSTKLSNFCVSRRYRLAQLDELVLFFDVGRHVGGLLVLDGGHSPLDLALPVAVEALQVLGAVEQEALGELRSDGGDQRDQRGVVRQHHHLAVDREVFQAGGFVAVLDEREVRVELVAELGEVGVL